VSIQKSLDVFVGLAPLESSSANDFDRDRFETVPAEAGEDSLGDDAGDVLVHHEREGIVEVLLSRGSHLPELDFGVLAAKDFNDLRYRYITVSLSEPYLPS
jgi:hypothetical protein